MSADAILAHLIRCGIEPSVTPDETGIVVPAGVLTADQRQAIKANKAELIEAIREAARLTDQLLQAAMQAAAHWQDEPAAWRAQCLEVPPHQRADLLAHLRSEYGGQRHE